MAINYAQAARTPRHAVIRQIFDSIGFNLLISGIVVTNIVFIVIDLDEDLGNLNHKGYEKVEDGKVVGKFYSSDYYTLRDTLYIFDIIFILVYTMEFALCIYVEPKDFWKRASSAINFLVIVALIAERVVRPIAWDKPYFQQTITVFKMLAVFKLLRMIRFVRGIQVLFGALVQSLREWIMSLLFLILIVTVFFAILGRYLFGIKKKSAQSSEPDVDDFGILGSALVSIAAYLTSDGWADVQENLENLEYIFSSRLFAMIVIFIGSHIMSNVFVSIVLVNIDKATVKFKEDQRAEREKILLHKKEYIAMRQRNDLQKMIERTKRGNFNFYELIEKFQKGLHHSDVIELTDMCTNTLWLETYLLNLNILDATMHSIQQLHFEMVDQLSRIMEAKLHKRFKSSYATNKNWYSTISNRVGRESFVEPNIDGPIEEYDDDEDELPCFCPDIIDETEGEIWLAPDDDVRRAPDDSDVVTDKPENEDTAEF